MATAGVAVSKSFHSSGLLLQRSSPATSCRVQSTRQCVAVRLSDKAFRFSHARNLAGSVSFLSGCSIPNRVPASLSRAKRGKGSTRAKSGGNQEGVQFKATRSSDLPGSPASLERSSKRDAGPPFAAISVGGPQQEPEAVVSDPDGILDPEDMEAWLSEMEFVDSQDGASVSFSRADRIQKKADAAVLLEQHPAWQAGPRKFIASVRKALPPSIGDSPQGLAGLGGGVLLLILALLWALFRKKEEPQEIVQNAGFGNSPPGTGPSGVVKSGDRYSALKSGTDDVSYKVGGAAQKAGNVAQEVKEEATKKAQDSFADLRERVEHVKQADNKAEAGAKQVKGALQEGKQTLQWWAQKAEEKVEESTDRSGTGNSTLKPSGVSKTEPVKGGARVEGSVGRSGTGESLKPSSGEGEGLGRMTPGAPSVATLGSMLQDKGDSGSNGGVRSGSNGGVSRTVTSGVKGAPVKENEQLVKSDVGEPGDKTLLPERKPRSEGDSSTHGGESKTVVSGVKGAPTKELEELVKSAVGDPTEKLSAKPLPERKEPATQASSSVFSFSGAAKTGGQTFISGVEGSNPQELESLVKSTVGKPNSDDAETDSANGKPDSTGSKASPSPFQANTADSVLSARGVTDKPGDRAGVTAPKTPFQVNAADSVLSRAPQTPGQSELAAGVAELSAVLGQAGKAPNPRGQGLKRVAPGATEGADDVATLVSELSQVLNESKKEAAGGKAPSTGASTPPQKGSVSDALPSKRADETLPIPLNVGSQTSATPLGGEVRSAADVISSAPAKPLGGKVQSAADAKSSTPITPLGNPTPPVGGPTPAKPSEVLSQTPIDSAVSLVDKLTAPGRSEIIGNPPDVLLGAAQNPAKPSEVISETPTDSAESLIDKLTAPGRSEIIGSKDKTAGQASPPIVNEALANKGVALPTEGWEPGADSSALVDVDSGALVEVDSSVLVDVNGSPLVERESDADSAPEILEKIFVEDLPLPSPTKKKTGRFDRAQIIAKVQNVLPALAVSVGAAGALTGGVDGALETVGFAALASFASSKLLWANSREELTKELKDIKSSKDLVEFLKEKDITPDP